MEKQENIVQESVENVKEIKEQYNKIKFSADELNKIIHDPRPNKYIAEEFNVCSSTIARIKRKAGTNISAAERNKARDNKGENNPRYGAILSQETKDKISEAKKGKVRDNRKFSREQILEIRSSTKPYSVLAEEYGVDKSMISNIKNKKCYEDIE